MFYILDYQSKQANWIQDFRDCLMLGMGGKAILVEEVPASLSENDYVFVLDYRDFDSKQIQATKAKIIGHVNGTSASPYSFNVNREAEMNHFRNVLDIVTFSSEVDRDIVFNKYGSLIKDSVVIGFPINPKKFESYQKASQFKQKKIVVGGRISPDKQFYLATYLLKDLAYEYEVVFSVLDNDFKWSDFYDIQRFADEGLRYRYNPTSETFYNELQNADVYFSCSLGDTIGLGAYEASMLGCRVIVPQIDSGFPSWRAYVSHGYKPFDKAHVEEMIRSGERPTVNGELFNYENVCQKLMEKCSL